MTHRTPSIAYRHGLAVLRDAEEAPPWMVRDRRADAYTAPGSRLPELRLWAAERGIGEATPAPDPLDGPLFDPRQPRGYQREAVTRWEGVEGRGTVVLPTGAGKTLVAILATHRTARGTCVVAPTRALVAQWFSQLADAFGAERVGAFYSDEKEVRPITVTTYRSCFALMERFGERFDLLVLDEAHHLADGAGGEEKAVHDALLIAPARYRLGLTATYPDGRDQVLRRLLGPVSYRKTIGEMADAELARFATQRRFVALAPRERDRYEALTEVCEGWIAERGYRDAGRFPTPEDGWRVFMAETRRSPAARRAHRAWLERERLVALPEGKLAEAGRILRLYPAERAILFCGTADSAEAVSRHFAVPLVRADTPASERKWILDRMAAGEIRAVASVEVLDEGWDVPGVKLGIVLADSSRGSRRQHAQRLGRLLRRQGDAVASLYELVAEDTHEFLVSQKRRSGIGGAAAGQLGLGV